MMNLKIETLLLAAFGLMVSVSCSHGDENKTIENKAAAVPVVVATAAESGLEGMSLSGQIEAAQSVNISTRIMGYITRMDVKVGDPVKKGQLLVTISNQDILSKRAQIDAMIQEAEAGLSSAQKDFDRFNILFKQQSATAKELDNVTLQYNAALSRLESARQMRNEVNANLGYTRLTAPFAGVISQKLAEAGSMASPGMTLLTLEQGGTYQVNATVPENLIRYVHPGAEAIVTVKSAGISFTGKITQLNPSSQFTGGQYSIKIDIPSTESKGLYAGMYVSVLLPLKEGNKDQIISNSVMVPVSSVEHKDQLTGLYTISSNNTALLRWVRLGKTVGDKVEVLSGLSKNELFVVAADGKLYNGVPVKVKQGVE